MRQPEKFWYMSAKKVQRYEILKIGKGKELVFVTNYIKNCIQISILKSVMISMIEELNTLIFN